MRGDVPETGGAALSRLEVTHARAELLARCHTELDLGDAVDRVHLEYYPPGEGFTYREWLEKVERYLREHEV